MKNSKLMQAIARALLDSVERCDDLKVAAEAHRKVQHALSDALTMAKRIHYAEETLVRVKNESIREIAIAQLLEPEKDYDPQYIEWAKGILAAEDEEAKGEQL